MSAIAGGEVIMPEGGLTFDSLPRVLAEAAEFARRADFPPVLTVDFSRVSAVDSAALALLLEWRREATRRGSRLAFVNLPANLVALATLYGIEQLIQPAT